MEPDSMEPDSMDSPDPMEPGSMNSPDPTTGAPRTVPPTVCWAAVARGAGVGLAVLVGVAALRAVLDRSVDDLSASGWTLLLFVVLLAGYFLAGWIAQRVATDLGVADAPYTHGALAGLGAFVGWVPLRVAIWLVRDEHRGLVRGSDGALRPGQVFGALVIATGVGVLGAVVAAHRRSDSSDVES